MAEPEADVTGELPEVDEPTEAWDGGMFGTMQTAMFGPAVAEQHQRQLERARELAEAHHGAELALAQLRVDAANDVRAHRTVMRRHAERRARGVAWQHQVIPVVVGAIGAEVVTLLAMFGWRVFG